MSTNLGWITATYWIIFFFYFKRRIITEKKNNKDIELCMSVYLINYMFILLERHSTISVLYIDRIDHYSGISSVAWSERKWAGRYRLFFSVTGGVAVTLLFPDRVSLAAIPSDSS